MTKSEVFMDTPSKKLNKANVLYSEGVRLTDIDTFKMGSLIFHMSKSATCLLYTSPSPRDGLLSRMPSSA